MNGQQPRPRGRAGRGRHDHILLTQSADHLTTPQPMRDITVKSRTPNAAELCCFRCYSTSCVATSPTGGALSRPNKYPQSWKWDGRRLVGRTTRFTLVGLSQMLCSLLSVDSSVRI